MWLTGLPLEFSGAAHTGTAGPVPRREVWVGVGEQCLADTWQPVHNEFLPLWYSC